MTRASKTALPLWRWVALGLCLCGFLTFFLPVFGGIVNFVNLGAMGGFLVLAAVFLRWPAFLRGLGWFWRRPWGRVLVLVTGVGLLALALTVGILCGKVTAKLRSVPETDCPTLIVLGCQVRGTAPSLLLSYRIQTAADYLKAHPQAAAILSGGKGSGENLSEAACMYNTLIDLGIDPARLYQEDQSRTTEENLQFSRALMEREGLEGPVLIVSNDFHIYRALRIAADLGLTPQGLSAPSTWYSRPTYILREALALIYYLTS